MTRIIYKSKDLHLDHWTNAFHKFHVAKSFNMYLDHWGMRFISFMQPSFSEWILTTNKFGSWKNMFHEFHTASYDEMYSNYWKNASCEFHAAMTIESHIDYLQICIQRVVKITFEWSTLCIFMKYCKMNVSRISILFF